MTDNASKRTLSVTPTKQPQEAPVIGNLLHSMIPSLKDGDDVSELTDEEMMAQEKKDRIEFHRAKVRNGPAKFKKLTSGQVRRARARDTKTMMKRARRKQIRTYFASQKEGMILRGHLQSVGILDFSGTGVEVPPQSAHRAAMWLIAHFGEIPAIEAHGLNVEIVENAFQAALNRWQTIVGLPITALPEDYVVSD